MRKYKVTIDTNILDDDKIAKIKVAIKGRPIEIAVVSVSDREIKGADIKPLPIKILETAMWDESEWDNSVWGHTVNETLVLGQSNLGNSVLGSTQTADLMEALLKVISNGSFPKVGKRDNLDSVPEKVG